MKQLSIIVLTNNRLASLQRCIDNVFDSPIPPDSELIIVLNGENIEIQEYIDRISTSHTVSHNDIRTLVIPASSNGKGRNIAIQNAEGQILYFLDDDVAVEKGTFQKALEKFEAYPEVDVVGGPNLTPSDSSLFQECSGLALASPFGTASVRYRYASKGAERIADEKSLILCNLAIRKRIFHEEGLAFNENVSCNEENILLQQIDAKKMKMLHVPDLVVYHERRSTPSGFWKQIFKYGRGRGQNIRLLPRTFSFPFAIPSLFILFIAISPVLPQKLALATFLLYFILSLGFSFYISMRERRITYFACLSFLFPLMHISYGLGFLFGLLEPLLSFSKRVSCF
jgi:cellulose synthase/poly-beta-1,6-N-acetylglucosamine synthase-like glycosyltransferase